VTTQNPKEGFQAALLTIQRQKIQNGGLEPSKNTTFLVVKLQLTSR